MGVVAEGDGRGAALDGLASQGGQALAAKGRLASLWGWFKGDEVEGEASLASLFFAEVSVGAGVFAGAVVDVDELRGGAAQLVVFVEEIDQDRGVQAAAEGDDEPVAGGQGGVGEGAPKRAEELLFNHDPPRLWGPGPDRCLRRRGSLPEGSLRTRRRFRGVEGR